MTSVKQLMRNHPSELPSYHEENITIRHDETTLRASK
jgi:hypothetical protein